jgi:hypothetical protein
LHTNKNTKCIGSSSFLGLDGWSMSPC